MNQRRLLTVAAFLLLIGWACAQPRAAQGCAAAGPRNIPVAIASETAIIIWDEKTETEHFIRRASFTTEAKDFGFLVPTPTQPTLAEASDEAFKILARITEPRIVQQKRPAGGGGCALSCGSKRGMPEAAAPGSAVEVLEKNTVSGFDYAILKTSDADTLNSWLEKEGYDYSPAIQQWAKHYVEAQWIITAFKVAKGPDGKQVATKAVRMSFKTPRPFFPYREPDAKPADGQAPAARLLRVYFLSAAKAKGTLGDKGQSWPGSLVWANKIAAEKREQILEKVKLPKETPPDVWWLTEFEDQSNPRPGSADVYFGPAGDEAPVERAPHVQYVSNPVPDCVMTYALIGFLVVPRVYRSLVRRRKARESA